MIELDKVSFSYSKRVEPNTPLALKEVSLKIKQGEMIAIIGHNGSGKSTLARLITALQMPTQGEVLIDGDSTRSPQALKTIRQKVGLVFQHPDEQLVSNSVIDDIAFGPENLGLSHQEINQRVEDVLALFDLHSVANLSPNDLAVGQKQRVAIAGVLAMRPTYLLLDEPTTMLPNHLAQELIRTLRHLVASQNVSAIHITHFMHEAVHFDRVIVMHEGQVEMDGTPAEIFAQDQRLHELGLEVPMITQLGKRLYARGYDLPETITSLEQLKAVLCSLH